MVMTRANRLTALGAAADVPALPDEPTASDAARRLHAGASGPDCAAQWSGTGAARARPMPAAKLMALLEQESRAHFPGLGACHEGR